MSPEEVLIELKEKGLLTFGTHPERKDRLKKFYGKIYSHKYSMQESTLSNSLSAIMKWCKTRKNFSNKRNNNSSRHRKSRQYWRTLSVWSVSVRNGGE